MYQEEIHFGKLFLKQSETVLIYLTPVSLTFDPVNPKSIGVLCCPGRMYGPGLRSRPFPVIDRKQFWHI